MKKRLFALFIALCMVLSSCTVTIAFPDDGDGSGPVTDPHGATDSTGEFYETEVEFDSQPVMLDDEVAIPAWEGDPFIIVNDNMPTFSASEKKCVSAFESYSELDEMGRCGVAVANICKELMPTEKRGDISRIHPTGWQKSMGWERCHLIGFQLAGENANKLNLITGTRYFNVTGMLPFENQVADYAEQGGHVLYRVTPIFNGDDLVASGAEMEGWSVEDKGKSVCFNVYVFNVTPDYDIDYDTGIVTLSSGSDSQSATVGTVIPDIGELEETVYVSASGKYHTDPNCSGMKKYTEMNLSEAESGDYIKCPKCVHE